MRLGGPAHGIVTKTVHINLPGGGGGLGMGRYRVTGGDGDPGVGCWGGGCLFDMKLTLSVRHNCLKLKMII